MHADSYDLFNYTIESTFYAESPAFDLIPPITSSIQSSIIISIEYTINLWGQIRTASYLPLYGAYVQIFSLDISSPPFTCTCIKSISSDDNGVYSTQFIGSDLFYYFVVISSPSGSTCKIFTISLPYMSFSEDLIQQYSESLLDYLPSTFNITSFVHPLSVAKSSIFYVLPTYT